AGNAVDPLEHVEQRLPAGSAQRALTRELRERCAAYAAAPLGGRRRGAGGEGVAAPGFQVRADLALDADVRLPDCVATELERAAELLWRRSPAPPSPLAEYHAACLERFGTDRLIPVKQLLNPDSGLGLPSGYDEPRS